MRILGEGWAQPVTNRPWAFVASVLFAISRASGHRTLNSWKHAAWQRACGVDRTVAA